MGLVGAPQAIAAKPERPYGGDCSTVILPQTRPGVFPQQLSITYDCTLAHLGRTTAVVNQTVTPAGPPSGTTLPLFVQNTTIYMAANGDQLNATFVGAATLDLNTGEVAFTGVETFAGGSGRFAVATGFAKLDGAASIFTNKGTFTSKGRIAY
jgi:hypothetical protein